MSVVELDRSPDRFPTAEARRAAAKQHYLAAVAAGRELTGDDIGRHFGRSGRWGRDVIAEATAELPAGDDGSQPAEDRRPWWAVMVTVVVALVAAAASYGHMLELALEAGEPEAIAYAVPLTVDGLVLAALMAGERGRWWLRLGLAVSLAGNVAAADPTPVGVAVAAWPPVALYGTHRLWHR